MQGGVKMKMQKKEARKPKTVGISKTDKAVLEELKDFKEVFDDNFEALIKREVTISECKKVTAHNFENLRRRLKRLRGVNGRA